VESGRDGRLRVGVGLGERRGEFDLRVRPPSGLCGAAFGGGDMGNRCRPPRVGMSGRVWAGAGRGSGVDRRRAGGDRGLRGRPVASAIVRPVWCSPRGRRGRPIRAAAAKGSAAPARAVEMSYAETAEVLNWPLARCVRVAPWTRDPDRKVASSRERTWPGKLRSRRGVLHELREIRSIVNDGRER